MDQITLKEKKELLENLKELFNKFEEVEHQTCFDKYFTNNFVKKYYDMSNDIDHEIQFLEEEINSTKEVA